MYGQFFKYKERVKKLYLISRKNTKQTSFYCSIAPSTVQSRFWLVVKHFKTVPNMMDNVLNIAIKGHLTNSNCFIQFILIALLNHLPPLSLSTGASWYCLWHKCGWGRRDPDTKTGGRDSVVEVVVIKEIPRPYWCTGSVCTGALSENLLPQNQHS